MAAPDAGPDPELLEIYRAEAVDTMATVNAHLLRIEQGAPERDALLEDVLRLAHDIKGSANMVGYRLVGRLAHALEACLLTWRGGGVPPASASLAFRAIDHIRDLSLRPDDAELQQQGEDLARALRLAVEPSAAPPPPDPAASPPAPGAAAAPDVGAVPAPAASPLLRVRRDQVDGVSDEVGLALMDVQGLGAHLHELGALLEQVSFPPPPPESAPPAELRQARARITVGLRRAREAYLRLANTLRQLDGHARELDERARRLSLVPAAPLLSHLERTARDAATALGRHVRVEVDGREQLIDILLVEELKGPLTHAVRNAVDHGLEPPDQRLAAGKPATGVLRLVLAEEGALVRLAVADDGRGVDLAAARRKLGEAARDLDDECLLAALLRSGVSTRDQVTSISGRGLGLGAAAMVADRLRGRAMLASRPGLGTTLTLELPRQLSLVDVLIVRSGGVRFALPVTGLREVAPACADAPALAAVLGLSCPPPTAAGRVLVLAGRDGDAAVAVDDGVESRTVVRRPLPAHLGSVSCVQGATILPGGEPVLLLDPLELAAACRGARPATAARRRALVVDDSETVRRSLAGALQLAGWEVTSAADGQDALLHLAAAAFDAVISDVQMPRRDGFAVAQACSGRTPCLLVTSAPSADGAARARGLGSDYLAKDATLPARVLAALERLVPASRGAAP